MAIGTKEPSSCEIAKTTVGTFVTSWSTKEQNSKLQIEQSWWLGVEISAFPDGTSSRLERLWWTISTWTGFTTYEKNNNDVRNIAIVDFRKSFLLFICILLIYGLWNKGTIKKFSACDTLVHVVRNLATWQKKLNPYINESKWLWNRIFNSRQHLNRKQIVKLILNDSQPHSNVIFRITSPTPLKTRFF